MHLAAGKVNSPSTAKSAAANSFANGKIVSPKQSSAVGGVGKKWIPKALDQAPEFKQQSPARRVQHISRVLGPAPLEVVNAEGFWLLILFNVLQTS